MCIDSETQKIYIFGGRIVQNSDQIRILNSGLYEYDIQLNKWRILK